MPIYATKCRVCHAEKDVYLPLKRFYELPICCGQEVDRKITAPMVMNDIQPYRSMIDGSMIESRSKHKEHLRRHGCIEIGNETKHLKAKPLETAPGLKKTLIEVANSKL